MQKITIGLKHYTGAACSFGFTDSVCTVAVPQGGEELTRHNRNLARLKAIYPGSKVEDVAPPPQVAEIVKAVEGAVVEVRPIPQRGVPQRIVRGGRGS